MKKLIALLCLASFILAGCQGVEVSESSVQKSESSITESSVVSEVIGENESSEEIKEWTETETKGNTKITREYRDGKNDYTVTEERFREDETLSYKKIYVYKKEILTKSEVVTFDENGNVVSSQITAFDDLGAPRSVESTETTSEYIVCAVMSLDSYGKIESGTKEYTYSNGEKIADSKVERKIHDGFDCITEAINVYKKGKLEYLLVKAYSVNDGYYSLREYINTNAKVEYTETVVEDTRREVLLGENGCVLEITGNKYKYTETYGDLIAVAELNSNGLIINSVGDNYNSNTIVDVINEINERIDEYKGMFLI